MGDCANIKFEILDSKTNTWECCNGFEIENVQNYTVFRYLFNLRNSESYTNLNSYYYVEPIRHSRGVDVQSGYGYCQEETYYFINSDDLLLNNRRTILEISKDAKIKDVRDEVLYSEIINKVNTLKSLKNVLDVRLVATIF